MMRNNIQIPEQINPPIERDVKHHFYITDALD